MPLLTESAVRDRARVGTGLYENASAVLAKRVQKQAGVSQHDIFLSHAFDDRELVLGVALSMEDLGYAVYLDWRDDPSLDRKNITAHTAEKLRARMKSSRCLFYSTTENAISSKWMQWELGFKDGSNSRVAILPVSRATMQSYQGQEYLAIYPYVTYENDTSGKRRLWIQRSTICYVNFDSWLEGEEPAERK